jgi:hypothetical protein
MHYLIYVSSAEMLMSSDDLMFLLTECREKNPRVGVTGMLLYKGGNFMQMLEGEQSVIMALYEKIKRDRRHKDVIKILDGQIQQRNFENWSMGFVNMDKAGDDYPPFNEFFAGKVELRKFQEDAQLARQFIVNFNESTW